MARPNPRRRRIALFVSLLIHAALLAPLLFVAPGLRYAQAPNPAHMLLGLVPESGLGIAMHRAAAGQPSTRQPARALTSPQPAAPPKLTPPSATTAPSPPANNGAQAGAATAANQDAVRRALHAALACAPSNAQNLDEETRAACRKRLRDAAVAMGDAKVDTIPPLKRAYYDAVQKAYQDIRDYPTPDTTLTHLPGAEGIYDQRLAAIHGHLAHAGCGLKFGGPPGATPSGAPPHSLFFKVGPVICGVTPPQGVLTEESATPNADDVR